MKGHNSKRRYVLCVRNKNYAASLELGKVYLVIEDVAATRRGFLRIVDESGEDYLYPKNYFVSIKLPKAAEGVLQSIS